MEELELKHLAPYLPYKLMVKVFDEKPKVMNATNSSSTNWVGIGAIIKWRKNCKPILRPLSDLNKEIDLEGKSFIPIVELAKTAFNHCYDLSTYELVTENGTLCLYFKEAEYPESNCHLKMFFEVDIDNSVDFGTGVIKNIDGFSDESFLPIQNQLQLFELLFKWHFDVFGLIENGHALDINSMED